MGGELPMKEAKMAIAALDSDGDGLLSLEDFIALMEARGEEQKLNDLKVAFDMYDTKSCGFITPKSLKRMLKKMGGSKSIDECKSMIKQFDLNGDGYIPLSQTSIPDKMRPYNPYAQTADSSHKAFTTTADS
ncbi:hypothetical protein JHK85_045752 [Glycine max]|nr:hypothetical protein JHK85_045752 [Glycine max]